MKYERVTKCRTCYSENLLRVLDLGDQPLANALKEKSNDTSEPKYPLNLVQCGICSLIQIDVNVAPELMFSNYNWVTGTSKSSTKHCQNFAKRTLETLGHRPQALLEIGSNDGTLLKEFVGEKIKLLVGIDPAENLTRDYGPEIYAENLFFNASSARKIYDQYGKFDVVIARNVFSHIADFNEAISGVSTLLDSDSIFLMDFHWGRDILLNLHYDSIYHEHTYYHTIASVSDVLQKFGLNIFDVFESPISGGSVVVVASKQSRTSTSDLTEMRKLESLASVGDYESWKEFGKKARENLEQVTSVIEHYKDKKICAFGASARSSTILNALGSSATRILSIAENNHRKWGKYSPGVGLPIEPVEKMLSRDPDLIILFPFNFKTEILQQLSRTGWSGSVLLPIPHPPQLLQI
jgi:SAM-dependent methyltransferase